MVYLRIIMLKSAPSNFFERKKIEFEIKNVLFGYLGKGLKKLLSYFKQTSRIFTNAMFRARQKNHQIWDKNALFGYLARNLK